MEHKRTQLSVLNTDFAIENETQTCQTKHSITGISCSNVDLNTAGEKQSLSVFVEILI